MARPNSQLQVEVDISLEVVPLGRGYMAGDRRWEQVVAVLIILILLLVIGL